MITISTGSHLMQTADYAWSQCIPYCLGAQMCIMINKVLRIRISKDPKLLPSRIRIRIWNKLMSRIRIRIRNYHWGSGLLKNKCSDKNTIFKLKSSIWAQKWPLNAHSDFKFENFTKISCKISRKFQSRIRIRIQKDPRAGSGSEMTLQVGSGSEIIVSDPQHWINQ